MATKIRTSKEIFGEFKVMQELSNISASMTSKNRLTLIEVKDFAKFNSRMNLVEDLYHGLVDTDIVYICGQHGSCQRQFARDMVSGVNAPFLDKLHMIYDYIDLRDMLKGQWKINDEILYSHINSIEASVFRYINAAISSGHTTSKPDRRLVVSDIGTTSIRRRKVIDQCTAKSQNFYTTCIYLLGSYPKMIERNTTYTGISKDFEDYLKSSQIDFPSFQEGFNSIVIINETSERDRNFMSCSMIESQYRKMYADNLSVNIYKVP